MLISIKVVLSECREQKDDLGLDDGVYGGLAARAGSRRIGIHGWNFGRERAGLPHAGVQYMGKDDAWAGLPSLFNVDRCSFVLEAILTPPSPL